MNHEAKVSFKPLCFTYIVRMYFSYEYSRWLEEWTITTEVNKQSKVHIDPTVSPSISYIFLICILQSLHAAPVRVPERDFPVRGLINPTMQRWQGAPRPRVRKVILPF